MTKQEKTKLVKQAKLMKGRRSTRYINEAEIEEMAELDRKRTLSGKTIRVYSSDGFVPNSYKYAAYIDAVERTYDANGKKHFDIIQVGASRPNGRGALITVNNRAYND